MIADFLKSAVSSAQDGVEAAQSMSAFERSTGIKPVVAMIGGGVILAAIIWKVAK